MANVAPKAAIVTANDNPNGGTVVTPFEISIANVGAETNPTWNTVDGAGKYFADANRRYRIDGSAVSRGVLDGQNQFRCGAEGVAPVGHQNSARMPA